MKKAESLIPEIIKASNRDEAIDALNSVVQSLHLSQNFFNLVDLKDRMNTYQVQFRELGARYKSITIPEYNALHDLRLELNFLYRDINDDLAFEINKAKIFNEERKTAVRADSMVELSKDETLQKTIKAKSTSSLRDIVGISTSYKEYISMAAYSYGLYSEFHKLMDGIKMMTDSIASQARHAQQIENKDVK